MDVTGALLFIHHYRYLFLPHFAVVSVIVIGFIALTIILIVVIITIIIISLLQSI